MFDLKKSVIIRIYSIVIFTVLIFSFISPVLPGVVKTVYAKTLYRQDNNPVIPAGRSKRSEGNLPKTQEIALENPGKTKHDKFFLQLIESLNDKDPKVRKAAEEALSEMGDDKKEEFLKAYWTRLYEKISNKKSYENMIPFITKNTGSIFFNPLIKLSLGKDIICKDLAFNYLRSYMFNEPSSEHIDNLVKNLKDKDKKLRLICIKLLGETNNPKHLKHLEPIYINDPELEVRIGAMNIINWTYKEKALPFLVRALEDKDYRVRSKALELMGRDGDVRAEKYIIKMLKDENDAVRSCAVYELRHYKNPDNIKYLIEKINDKNPRVAQFAISSLHFYNNQTAVDAIKIVALDVKSPNREEAIRILSCYPDPKLMDLYEEVLKRADYDKKGDENVIVGAIDAIGRTKRKKGFDVLIKYLDHPDYHIRSHTVSSLQSIRDKRAIPFLLKRLDKDPDLKKEIIASLGVYKDTCVIPVLTKTLKNKDTFKCSMNALADLNNEKSNKLLIDYIRKNRKNLTYSQTSAVLESFEKIRSSEAADLAAELLPDFGYSNIESLIAFGLIEEKATSKSIVYLRKIEKEILESAEDKKKHRLPEDDIKKNGNKPMDNHNYFLEMVRSAIREIKKREENKKNKNEVPKPGKEKPVKAGQ